MGGGSGDAGFYDQNLEMCNCVNDYTSGKLLNLTLNHAAHVQQIAKVLQQAS